MPIRKEVPTNGQYYHVFVRSIAGFVVFNSENEYGRMKEGINYYKYIDFNIKYSRLKKMTLGSQLAMLDDLEKTSDKFIDVVSYCLMPTHIHLLLKQGCDNGVSIFMKKLLQSYSNYFNIAHRRNGPLWASRFKNVLIKNDEQLLHLTRYIHLNPTSVGLVKKPEDWKYSSYRAYITGAGLDPEIIDLNPGEYKEFVDDRRDYQKELSKIKALLIDHYTG